MTSRQSDADIYRTVALILGALGTAFVAVALGVAAGAAVGFGAAAALCFAWVLVLVATARRIERDE